MKTACRNATSIIIAFFAAFLSGCMPHVMPQQIPVTPQLLQQVGLPLYPHAKPISGQEMTPPGQRSASIIIMLQSTDDPAKVESFYLKRLPSSTRKMSVSLGFVKPELLQYFDAHGIKQVSIMTMMGSTMIQLQSTPLNRPIASP